MAEAVLADLQRRGHDLTVFGPLAGEKMLWPTVPRLWNNANVLCLSLRHTAEAVGKEILDAWFNNAYRPDPEDDVALRQVEDLERTYRSGEPADTVESSSP